MKLLLGSALALVAGLSTVRASVFDDAAFWYHASSPNAGGAFRTGDFTDNRFAADADHWLNQSSVEGVASCVQVREENVVHPYSCATNVERVIRLEKVVSGASASAGILKMPNLFTVTNSGPMTVVLRLRWDGMAETLDSGNTRSEVLGIGFNGASTVESGYYIALDRTTRRFYVVDRKKYATLMFGGESDDYRVTPDEWVDVAFAWRGEGHIDMYLFQEGSSMVNGAWHNATATLKAETIATTDMSDTPFRLGAIDTVATGARSGKSASAKAFSGSFSQVAIWARCLSQGEIAEAFGGSALKFEYGVENGLSSEFGGTGEAVVANVTNAWRLLPPALTDVNPSVSIDFDVPAYEAGLPQMLRFVSTPQSSAGMLAVSLNGEPVAEDVVSPGKATMFDIKKNLLVDGKNTLTLTWKGTGALGIDALACGGSWQLGYDDGSCNEFMKTNQYRKKYFLAGPQTWGTRCNRNIYASSINYADNTIVFSLPESFTSKRRYNLDFRCYRNLKQVPPTVKVTLNGVEKVVQAIDAPSPGLQTVSIPLAEGDLRPGVNEVRFDSIRGSDPTADDSVYADYLRLTIRPERKGLTLSLR